MKYSLDNGKN